MRNTNRIYKPIVLVILDGWGLSTSWGGNAISSALPKNINFFWRDYPHEILQAFSKIAGPSKKVGNSEIGHSSIGAGRLVYQDDVRINKAIGDGSFYSNEGLRSVLDHLKKNNSSLHLIGLVSDGGIHSHEDHLYALLDWCKLNGLKNVFIHAILDGLDTAYTDALYHVEKLQERIGKLKVGKIASMFGRYYAMDREENWNSIKSVYLAMTEGKGAYTDNVIDAIKTCYSSNITDMYIPPFVVVENKRPAACIKNNDAVIFFNFRSDRVYELALAFVKQGIFGLFTKQPKNLKIATMTSYKINLPNIVILFKPRMFPNNLPQILAENSKKQLRIAESEKSAHVTYFFNGGRDSPYPGEHRLIIPSAKIKDLRQFPQMRAREITDKLLPNIKSKYFDFIVVNFANVDMLSHTGDIIATENAIKIIDEEVGIVVYETLNVGGAVLVTSDHGNAEQMIEIQRAVSETIHSLNPVPFILITPDNKRPRPISSKITPSQIVIEMMKAEHSLADIAPTILTLMKIKKPSVMTGHTLIGKLN